MYMHVCVCESNSSAYNAWHALTPLAEQQEGFYLSISTAALTITQTTLLPKDPAYT